MIIDRTLLEEFPFDGSFYEYKVDESKPLDERQEEEVLVLETKCDIQEVQKKDADGSIVSSFNVYFPFDKETGINIKRGMIFKGSIYGLNVDGIIIGIFPTQLGKCVCFLRDRDV